MSVNTVSGASLQKDLVSALRQARAANARSVDADTFTPASQDAGSAQNAGSAAQSGSAASAPAMSNDLMASLLQLQSDFSQMGLQNGVTSPTDPTDASGTAATSSVTDASQAAGDAAPVQRHRGHHHHPLASDAADGTQAGPASGASDTSSVAGTSSSGDTSSTASIGNGLDALLQQMTKAIAAYASGGPVGVAAAALTSTAKA
jgi:hypothetical protein